MDWVKGLMHISVTVRSSFAEEFLNRRLILMPFSVRMQKKSRVVELNVQYEGIILKFH